MTAKEALLERVACMSEDEAASWLLYMESDYDDEPLTPEMQKELEAGLRDIAEGRTVRGEAARQRRQTGGPTASRAVK